MAWFYEIRSQNNDLVKSDGGYKTEAEAMAAGKAEAQRLKSTGAMPGSGYGTIMAGQNAEAPTK